MIGLLFAPFFILHNIKFTNSISQNYDKYKDLVEMISWLFAGLMSLVAFSTLFLAFTYENKLIVASRSLKNFLRPYTQDVNDLRDIVISYENSISKDKIIRFIYYGFLIISFFSLLTWGTAVGFYTNFKFSFIPDFSIGSLLVFGIYSFYILLFLILFLLTIAIKLIILNKDPLDKGYLPDTVSICNVKYFIEKAGDICEFYSKNAITIDFFKNPAGKKSIYEAMLTMPLNIANTKYVIKFYDKKHKSLFTIYGETKSNLLKSEIAKAYYKLITEDFSEEIFNQMMNDENCYAICKIFDPNLNLVARYIMFKENERNYHVKFSLNKSINTEESKDNDANLVKGKDSGLDYCKYYYESGKVE